MKSFPGWPSLRRETKDTPRCGSYTGHCNANARMIFSKGNIAMRYELENLARILIPIFFICLLAGFVVRDAEAAIAQALGCAYCSLEASRNDPYCELLQRDGAQCAQLNGPNSGVRASLLKGRAADDPFSSMQSDAIGETCGPAEGFMETPVGTWGYGACPAGKNGGYQMRYCGVDGNWTSKISSVCYGEYRRWSFNTTVSEGIDPSWPDVARDENSGSYEGYHSEWGFVGNNWEVVLNPPENDGEGRVILGPQNNLNPTWLHIKLSENYPVYLRNVGLEMTDWYERKYNCVGGNFDTGGLGILFSNPFDCHNIGISPDQTFGGRGGDVPPTLFLLAWSGGDITTQVTKALDRGDAGLYELLVDTPLERNNRLLMGAMHVGDQWYFSEDCENLNDFEYGACYRWFRLGYGDWWYETDRRALDHEQYEKGTVGGRVDGPGPLEKMGVDPTWETEMELFQATDIAIMVPEGYAVFKDIAIMYTEEGYRECQQDVHALHLDEATRCETKPGFPKCEYEDVELPEDKFHFSDMGQTECLEIPLAEWDDSRGECRQKGNGVCRPAHLTLEEYFDHLGFNRENVVKGEWDTQEFRPHFHNGIACDEDVLDSYGQVDPEHCPERRSDGRKFSGPCFGDCEADRLRIGDPEWVSAHDVYHAKDWGFNIRKKPATHACLQPVELVHRDWEQLSHVDRRLVSGHCHVGGSTLYGQKSGRREEGSYKTRILYPPGSTIGRDNIFRIPKSLGYEYSGRTGKQKWNNICRNASPDAVGEALHDLLGVTAVENRIIDAFRYGDNTGY